jgi:hypothetical protein
VAVRLLSLKWSFRRTRAGILRSEGQAHEFSFLALFDPGADPEAGTTDHGVSRVVGMAISLSEFVLEQSAGILRIASHGFSLRQKFELLVSSKEKHGFPKFDF